MMNFDTFLSIGNFTEKEKMEIKSRLQYIKRIKGNISNLSKNSKYDELIFKFLENKQKLENLYI